MKHLTTIVVPLILVLAGCHHAKPDATNVRPKAQVEAVAFTSGELIDEVSFQAQSIFLVKNAILTPVNSYIQKTYVVQGDKVKTGQLLFELVTKERKATENLPLKDSVLDHLGVIQIKANSSGMVSAMVSQNGDYVTEGTQLCQISNGNSLVFTLQVPFEYNNLIKKGASCTIDLPDGTSITGTIHEELDKMSLNGQTRQYLVIPRTASFIPENLLATVKITTQKIVSNQILPIGCVLTDEMMQKFWVMKLVNDTTAVRINVKIGLKSKDKVQIAEPTFSQADWILSAGNYGLPDSALVNVVKH